MKSEIKFFLILGALLSSQPCAAMPKVLKACVKGLETMAKAAGRFLTPPTKNPDKTLVENSVEAWAASNDVYGYKLHIKPVIGVHRTYTHLTPKITPENLAYFDRNIAPQTISFSLIKNYFRDEPGRPKFHVTARVGNKVYHFLNYLRQPDGTKRPDEIKIETLEDFRANLLNRPDKPLISETVFALPKELRVDLQKFYEDRAKGIATIDGKIVNPSYDEGGFGIYDPTKPQDYKENCIALALGFSLKHWQKDYPSLAEIASITNVQLRDPSLGVTREGTSSLPMDAKPIAMIHWGADATETGHRPQDPAGEHHWFMLEQMGAQRFRKLNDNTVTVEIIAKKPWPTREVVPLVTP